MLRNNLLIKPLCELLRPTQSKMKAISKIIIFSPIAQIVIRNTVSLYLLVNIPNFALTSFGIAST